MKKKKKVTKVKFLTQSFFLLCFVFIGVLAGIQIANNDTGQSSYQQTNASKGEITDEEAVVEALEQKEDTTEKEEQLKGIKSANDFSELGDGFTNLVEKTMETVIEPTLSKIEEVLAGNS